MEEYFDLNGWRYDNAYSALYQYCVDSNAYLYFCPARTWQAAYEIAKMRDDNAETDE